MKRAAFMASTGLYLMGLHPSVRSSPSALGMVSDEAYGRYRAKVELEWKRNQPISITTGAELDAALDSIEHDPDRAEPVLAFLTGPTGFMAIGVGHPEISVLMFGTHDGKRPLHAVGDEVARRAKQTHPLLIFASYGRPFEFARWSGVPKKIATQAAKIFLQQGGVLWNGVWWEEEQHA